MIGDNCNGESKDSDRFLTNYYYYRSLRGIMCVCVLDCYESLGVNVSPHKKTFKNV